MTGTAGGQFEFRGDSDWFRVHFEAGKTYRIGEDGQIFDLKLYLPDGTPLAPTLAYANQITFVAPVTGDYWIAATDIGTGVISYSISATEIADSNPASLATSLTLGVGQTVELSGVAHDWHAVSLVAGQSYFVRSPLGTDLYLTDDTGQVITIQDHQLHYTATETGTYYVGLDSENSYYSLTLEAVADDHGEAPTSSGALAVGASTSGVWETGRDADWYAVTLTAGSSYQFTLPPPDGVLFLSGQGVDIYDSTGALVGSSASSYLPSAAVFSPETTGTYYVSARIAGDYYNPHGNWSYTLAAQLLPTDLADNALTHGTLTIDRTVTGNSAAAGDVDWYAITLAAGESYLFTMDASFGFSLTLRDASGAELVHSSEIFSTENGSATMIAYTAATGGAYFVEAVAYFAGGYHVRAENFSDDFANNSLTSGVLAVGGSAAGTFEVTGDRDWFAVELVAGTSYTFASTPYLGLTIRNAQGEALTDRSNADMHFSPATSGTYFLEASGNVGNYQVTIAQVHDDFREDMLSAGTIRRTTYGTDAAEIFASTADHDMFLGQGGDDRFIAGEGHDVFYGGAGTDTVSFATFGSGAILSLRTPGLFENGALRVTITSVENVEGSAFNDVLTGHSLANLLSGGDGDDVLDGYDGDDTLLGGAGADTLIGGAGNDRLDGAAGNDTASYALASAGVTVRLDRAAAQDTIGAGIDTLVSIENLAGSEWVDRLTGNAAANVIEGGNGNDVLNGLDGGDWLRGDGGNDTMDGGQGNDTLDGGTGNDRLDGSAGNDRLDGGEGIDTADYAAAVAGVTVHLAVIKAQNTGGAGIDTLVDVENLAGSSFADRLTGNALANALAGDDGNDTLNGLAGNDTLRGGAGDDLYYVDAAGDLVIEGADAGWDVVRAAADFTLSDNVEELFIGGAARNGTGNGQANTLHGSASSNVLAGLAGDDVIRGDAGRDTIDGGDGADLIDGGAGKDTLTGGAGRDVFQFRDGDFGMTRALADVITDFDHADHEKIQLNLVDANVGAAGNQAFAWIGSGAFTGVAGQLHYAQQAGNTYVEGDTDGDGLADFVIALTGTQALVASDFVL